MSEFFADVPQIKYEGKSSTNPFAFKYYNPEEIIGGKSMREQLKFAMSWWHTLGADGTDMFGSGTVDKSFGTDGDLMKLAKAKVAAGFEFMQKLGIDYFCFHDADLAPGGRTLAETYENEEIIKETILVEMKKTGIKNLWGTSNCFTHPRYMHGAGTAPNADVFAYAAGQIKKAIDLTVAFGGTGYVFWGGREGYETLLNTDMEMELDNMARLHRMAVEYARVIGFRGDFYIEPKPKEPTKHQYDFDAASTIAYLCKYHLDSDFRLNIEANHATLAGHTFQHELRYARTNGFFGSIDANQGDMLLGWDTDQFPSNVYETAMCMYEVLKEGGFTNGGLNFDAKTRRGSFELKDIAYAYIVGMDTFALGLRIADRLIQDGRIDQFVQHRYASYQRGIGAEIVSGQATLKTLAEYALQMGEVHTNQSGRQEELEGIINNIMFSL
ncbi:xylose isomerase [Ethanoligenens sp.]|uniref:xylose isomerase n=1 Tax=Ethanoligenens sp. TaxID=2099655 RepID=UPI0039EB317D